MTDLRHRLFCLLGYGEEGIEVSLLCHQLVEGAGFGDGAVFEGGIAGGGESGDSLTGAVNFTVLKGGSPCFCIWYNSH